MLLRCIALVLFTNICCECAAQAPEAAEIKNNKVKKITSHYKGQDGAETFVATYYYNENGDDTAYYEGDARKYYKTVGYNRKLQPLTIEKFFPSGTAMDKTTFTYKPDGSAISVNTDTQFGMKVTETYDKKGHRLSLSIPDGTVIKYVYNAKGQLTSSYSIPIKGEKKSTTTYTYDGKGKMVNSVNTPGNAKTSYQYDKNGLLKKRIVTSTDESGEKKTTMVEYEYGY